MTTVDQELNVRDSRRGRLSTEQQRIEEERAKARKWAAAAAHEVRDVLEAPTMRSHSSMPRPCST